MFRSCLEKRKFPTDYKNTNVVPAHKKRDKQNLKNYCLISWLPAAGKIFERKLYKNLYYFFDDDDDDDDELFLWYG